MSPMSPIVICRLWLFAFLIGSSFLSSETRAKTFLDRVRVSGQSVKGEIVEMTKKNVVLLKDTTKTTIANNRILSIIYQTEPFNLAQARLKIANGGYREAMVHLNKLDENKSDRGYIRQDIAFYKAYAKGKLALGGDGSLKEAGRDIARFLKRSPQNYHFYIGAELMGDLLTELGEHSAAEQQYKVVAEASWADYQMRSQVRLGRSLQAQKKHAAAIKMFELASQTTPKTEAEKLQQAAAQLGKATSLAETGKVQAGINLVDTVIRNADPKEKELHARAFITLGNCYLKINRTKEALLAFLRVDILYSSIPVTHAEALYNLDHLWAKVGEENRSRQARKSLREKYPASRWAKR